MRTEPVITPNTYFFSITFSCLHYAQFFLEIQLLNQFCHDSNGHHLPTVPPVSSWIFPVSRQCIYDKMPRFECLKHSSSKTLMLKWEKIKDQALKEIWQGKSRWKQEKIDIPFHFTNASENSVDGNLLFTVQMYFVGIVWVIFTRF